MALSRAPRRGFTPFTLIGDSMTLSSAERCGNRLKLWNTKPMRLRRWFSSAPLIGACDAPGRRRGCVPDWISSSRFTVRISVDLPEPGRAADHDDLARATSALMSTSAWYVAVLLVARSRS